MEYINTCILKIKLHIGIVEPIQLLISHCMRKVHPQEDETTLQSGYFTPGDGLSCLLEKVDRGARAGEVRSRL